MENENRSLLKTISYGFAYFADALQLIFFASVVFYYYEVEIGLAVGLIAVAFVIFAIWNMINDPLLGYISERSRSEKSVRRFGFRTPVIIISGVLMAIMFFFVFYTPNFNPVDDQLLIFIYMIILICALDACYTIYNSNFTAGVVTMFKSEQNRRRFALVGILLSTLGVAIIQIVILPSFIQYGNKDSFILAAGITSGLMIFSCIILIYGAREPEEVKDYYLVGRQKEQDQKIPFLKVVKTVLRKRNFIAYIVAYLCWAVAFNMFFASQVYYYKDVLKTDYSDAAIPFAAFFLMLIVGLVLCVPLAKKLGVSNLYAIGYLAIGIVFLNFLWAQTVLEMIVYMALNGIFYGFCGGLLIVVMSDTFDEITAELGVHQDATYAGIQNFFIRSAYLIVGIIIALVHIITEYNPDPNATQSALAIWGIRLHTGLIPAIFCFIAGGFFILVYDLKGEKRKRVMEKLNAKIKIE